MSLENGYNLWIWKEGAWQVLATYEKASEAYVAAQGRQADCWTCARIGTKKDEYLRAHCRDRQAYTDW